MFMVLHRDCAYAVARVLPHRVCTSQQIAPPQFNLICNEHFNCILK
jgi:hypothetical protein